MNARSKNNGVNSLQIIDIRKADITTIVQNLDLKPLGAAGLALLKEASRNIAAQFEYGDGEVATDEQTILTILATYLPDFVQKTSPVASTVTEVKTRGTANGPRRKSNKEDQPNGGFQGGSGDMMSNAA
jgi:hypothetical protein